MYTNLKFIIKKNKKKGLRMKRKLKIKKTIHGTDKMPRLSVFKSNKSIYIQAIDDVKNITLASTSSIDN